MSRVKAMLSFHNHKSRRHVSRLFKLMLVVLGVYLFTAAFTVYNSSRAPGIQASDLTAINTVESAQNTGGTKAAPITYTPVRMLFPDINLALDIEKSSGIKESNIWPLSDVNAHYADFTPGLGSDKGTLVIYGHRTWPVLRKTDDLALGNKLILLDENGKQWNFRLYDQKNVGPEQVDFIFEDVPFRVVVFTCNGWFNEYRRLMYFEPW